MSLYLCGKDTFTGVTKKHCGLDTFMIVSKPGMWKCVSPFMWQRHITSVIKKYCGLDTFINVSKPGE